MNAIDPAGLAPATWRQTLSAMPFLPVVLLAVAAHMMMFGMLTPVMAVYAQGHGAPDWQIGLMITVFAAGRLVADIPAGQLAHRTGLRPLLGIGLLLCSLGAVMAALASGYGMALAGRTLQGIGSGLFMTATMIYVAQQSDRRSRGKVMSLYQGAVLIGSAFGPSVGGFAASLFGLGGPFYLAALIGLVSGALPLLLFRDMQPPADDEKHLPAAGAMSLLLILPFALVLLANFAFFLTRTAGQWQLVPLLATRQFAIDPASMGLAMSLSAVANLVSLPLAAWLVDRVSRPALIAVSLLATAAALALIAMAATPAILYAAMIAIGLAVGIGGPAIGAYAVDVTPVRLQAQAMGMLRFAGDLGYLVGPLAIGALVDVSGMGYGGGLLVNAALLVGCGAVFVLIRRRLAPRPTHPLPASPSATKESDHD